MNHSHRALGVVLTLLLVEGVLSLAQTPMSDWISDIDVLGLNPFEVSFRLSNRGSLPLGQVTGRAVLSDQFGRTIDTLAIEPFSLEPHVDRVLSVASRWSFQTTGVYLVEIALDPGTGSPISNSLAFRILPVQLPLAPVSASFGEGLRTLYQQPVNWGLLRISAPDAWRITHGRRDVIVAIIDSGIDTSIPQLADSLWVNPGEIAGNNVDDDGNGYVDDIHGWDFRDADNSSLTGSPLHWHGTFVAGIIAAQPGEVPMVGVAPGVRIMDVRFLDSNNEFSPRDWGLFEEAIGYAVANGADIINLSIYANGRPPATLEAAIHRAVQAGVLVVGIAGNTRRAGVLYPGKYPDVYAVSATTSDDLLADFSATGPEVSFCAPGDEVTSFLPGGLTATRSGTSFAAPHVSGTLALILSAFPTFTASQAMDVLMESLIDLGPRGFDPSFGFGLIDAFGAVSR